MRATPLVVALLALSAPATAPERAIQAPPVEPRIDWRDSVAIGDDLVRTALRVLRALHRADPARPRVGVGDLRLPEGGYIGPKVGGGIGQATEE